MDWADGEDFSKIRGGWDEWIAVPVLTSRAPAASRAREGGAHRERGCVQREAGSTGMHEPQKHEAPTQIIAACKSIGQPSRMNCIPSSKLGRDSLQHQSVHQKPHVTSPPGLVRMMAREATLLSCHRAPSTPPLSSTPQDALVRASRDAMQADLLKEALGSGHPWRHMKNAAMAAAAKEVMTTPQDNGGILAGLHQRLRHSS